MRILFIDHYDSFSFNLIDWMEATNIECKIQRVPFDQVDLLACFYDDPGPVIISPGPKTPADARPTTEFVAKVIGRVPVLGVCLGHQILSTLAKCEIGPSCSPEHGVTRKVSVTGSRFIPDCTELSVGVYNSLTARPSSSEQLEEGWIFSGDWNGEVQMIENWDNPWCPAIGLQFHPESFLTLSGELIRNSWVKIITDWQERMQGQSAQNSSAMPNHQFVGDQASADAPLFIPS